LVNLEFIIALLGESFQSYDFFEENGGFNEEVDFESFSNLGVNFLNELL